MTIKRVVGALILILISLALLGLMSQLSTEDIVVAVMSILISLAVYVLIVLAIYLLD